MSRNEPASEDEHGYPVVPRATLKIAALERRAAHLDERLASGRYGAVSDSFDKGERLAIEAGILALKYHRSEVEGIGDVVTALEAVVVAHATKSNMAPAIADARRALEEWGDD